LELRTNVYNFLPHLI